MRSFCAPDFATVSRGGHACPFHSGSTRSTLYNILFITQNQHTRDCRGLRASGRCMEETHQNKKLELDPRNDPESTSKSPYPSSMTLCRILCLKETPDFLVERPPWPQLPAPSSRYILRQDSGNTEVCSYDILMSYAIIYHNTDPPHNFPSESPTKCHK